MIMILGDETIIGFITRRSKVQILPATKYTKNPEDILGVFLAGHQGTAASLRAVKSLPQDVTLHSLIEDL
ncbi:MAG TPA: hypothetical protein VLX29_02135 [Nitrospirota bacterium]|nr:hypothetical protein [Nitrospirota bacterium]